MMRIAAGIAIIVAAVSPARAEVTKLGGFELGKKARKTRAVKARLYGCTGQLRATTDRRHKIVKVRFGAGKCRAEAVAAAITKQQGRAPIDNAQGDKLWEGKTASLILSTSLSTRTTPVLLLVPPGAGSKRTCWPDDGFAPFWSRFKAALATDDPAKIAASFVFPARDLEGNVMFRTARELAGGWTEIIDATDAKQILDGELVPTCRVDGDRYKLFLESTYSELTATKVKGVWRWSAISTVTTN